MLTNEVIKWEHSESDKGQIYTRPEVVNFMLNVIGLNTQTDFQNARILEPSCGEGEFVIAIVKRLLRLSKSRPGIEKLANKILAVDMVNSSLNIAKRKISAVLQEYGYNTFEINTLLNQWFISSDFLLKDFSSKFTHIIGNPPYVRVENIPGKLLDKYRRLYSTMTDRADLYVAFFEKSLSLLKDNGKLSFICTDRWTKNIYGRSLRKLIDRYYNLELYLDLYGVEAFEKNVMTYPAITQLVKTAPNYTVLKHGSSFTSQESDEILTAFSGKSTSLHIRKNIVNGEKPWLLGSPDQVALIHKLEHKFSLLENAGCKVYIGAATGANKVYIIDTEQVGIDIEKERLVPVITASELKSGSIKWKSKHIINTYNTEGVINLKDYQGLSEYLNKHKETLTKRYIVKKDQKNWFKTIDRVYGERAKTEKLLIPDISSEPIVLYDKGIFHPNNSIYYICSSEWNLHALRVVLLSSITKLFISTYSTKIANGYLRYQAQHLRKLRIPEWNTISDSLKKKLIFAGKNSIADSYNELTYEVYQLNSKEISTLGI